MYTKELVKKIADYTGWSEANSKAFIKAFSEVVKEEVNNGKCVSIYGLGKFRKQYCGATRRYSPVLNKVVDCPARNNVKFSPSKMFKDFINK